MTTKDPLDGLSPPVHAWRHGGMPPALSNEHIVTLRDIETEHAQASLEEIAAELHYRSSLRFCPATVVHCAQGIV